MCCCEQVFSAPCVVLFLYTNSATECNGLVKGKLLLEEPKVLVLTPVTLDHQTLVLTLLVSVAILAGSYCYGIVYGT